MDDKQTVPVEDKTSLTKEQEIKLEIGPPERQPDEYFDEYKKRRARQNASVEKWLKGRPSKRKGKRDGLR